jgi:hypothetical protein
MSPDSGDGMSPDSGDGMSPDSRDGMSPDSGDGATRDPAAPATPAAFAPALDAVLRSRGRFGHREHLELAWLYLRERGPEQARPSMMAAIRHVAASHGTPDRYHETLTLTWLHLVAVHASASEAATFEEFIKENDGLLVRDLPQRHYSSERLADPAARNGWVAPDVRPLPTHV